MAKKIQNFNLGYMLLKPFVLLAFRLFYKQIHIENKQRVHTSEPIIIAPNHQNALMDALAILFSTFPQKTVFLARADIFQNKIIKSILLFLKILPVFRIRDGKDSLNKNDDIFDQSVDVLHDAVPLCLMAEGKHNHRRQLLPLVKGMFRIAFQAQENMPEKNIRIIPAGLDMGHYAHAGHHLIINFGEPIEVKDYMTVYTENPAVAINALRDRLSDEMKKQMHHINSDTYYESFYRLSYITNQTLRNKLQVKNTTFNRFLIRKQITAALDTAEENQNPVLAELHKKCLEYVTGLDKINLRDWIFEKTQYSFLSLFVQTLGMILALPLVIYGFIFHAILYLLPLAITRKIKDTQFHSSVNYVISFVLAQLFYLAYIIIALCAFPNIWLVLPFILSLFISGVFTFYYYTWIKKLWALWRYFFKTSNKSSELIRLKSLRKYLVDEVMRIINL